MMNMGYEFLLCVSIHLADLCVNPHKSSQKLLVEYIRPHKYVL